MYIYIKHIYTYNKYIYCDNPIACNSEHNLHHKKLHEEFSKNKTQKCNMCVALAHLCSTSCYMARPAGGIIVCEKKKTTPRRTPGLSVQLRCVVWKGLNPPRAQGQARLPQTNEYITRKSRFQRPKRFNDRKKTVTVTTRQSTIPSTKSSTLNDPSEHNLEHKKVARSTIHPEHALEHKKLHAQRPIRSTLWSTKSCTLNDPSGARFGAQKVARSTTYPEHALEHKKLHAPRPIRSTLWSTKSCTLNGPSGARFGAQKVARSTAHLEHALNHKKLHAQRPIRSTENSLECSVVSVAPTTFGGFAQVQGHFGGAFFLVCFYLLNLKSPKKAPFIPQKIARKLGNFSRKSQRSKRGER